MSPGTPSVTTRSGLGSPRRSRSAKKAVQLAVSSFVPGTRWSSTLRPSSVIPQTQSMASRGRPAVQALGDPVKQTGGLELAEVPAGEGLVLLPEALGHLAHGGATQQVGAGGVSERRFDIPRARPARFFGDFHEPPIGDSPVIDSRVRLIVLVGEALTVLCEKP